MLAVCYKNKDGGFGHGLEYDIKCSDSNPLALEFLLSIIRDTGIPAGDILDGAVEWVENNRNEDGSLKNPAALFEYPRAFWWEGGGQFHFATSPESEVVQRIPAEIIAKFLHHLSKSLREEGGWNEHGLGYWQPYVTILNLLSLKKFNMI